MNNSPKKKQPSLLFHFFFIRTVPAVIWVLLLLLLGLLGYSSMIKESLPDLEIPQAYVVTSWEGATPEMIEKEITTRIEKEIKGMKGLKSYYSSSQHQLSIVVVSFHAEMGVSEALLLLQRKVNSAQAHFPKSVEKPKIEESSVRDLPVATVNLLGNLDKSILENKARVLKEQLEQIQGIKKVRLVGESKKIVKILLHPERMKALGLSPSLVQEILRANNYDAPWGTFDDDRMQFRMRMTGTFNDLDAIRSLAITRMPDGNVIRLSDIGLVKKGTMAQKTKASLSWHNGPFVPVVAMNLHKSSGQDTIKLITKARQLLKEQEQSASWPAGLSWQISGDKAQVIDDELSRGLTNGWQAMLAVFAVLMVMLTWREALIAAISVPLTFLGAAAVLWAMGYSFNLLVIVGMIFALGLLIDDFILIMEGMHEAIFVKRLNFIQAVHWTITTYALPSLSGTVTTILVLLPLVFLGGIDGKFIRLIPLTAIVCLVLSYIVSVVLGPPLSRLVFDKRKKHSTPSRIDTLSTSTGAALSNWLLRTVIPSRKRALLWIGLAGLLFIFSLGAATSMRNTLYPKEDGRGLGITIQLSKGTDLEYSEEVAQRVGNILSSKPFLSYVFKVVGEKDAYSMGSFHDMLSPTKSPDIIGFSCFLVPRNERAELAHKYVEPLRTELEAALADEPGTTLIMSPETGGASSEDPLQIDIAGNDPKVLKELSIEVRKVLARTPGIVDIRDNIGPPSMELRLTPQEEALDFHQVSRQELASQMIALMEQEKIGTFRRSGNDTDMDIRLGTLWPGRNKAIAAPQDWEDLERLTIMNQQNQPVSLWSLSNPTMDESPTVIKRKNGIRSVTILAKLDDIYVTEVISRIRPILDTMEAEWPAGYSYTFAGEEEVDETWEKMGKMFILAMILVFAILALIFDSLRQPVIILFTVLFALIGVFCGFFWADIPFSFSAAIGVVALVGIVVNDSIILVDTMNTHRKQGMETTLAAGAGAADRLRPIASTTLTNLAGLLPLALSDPGWAPLCWAVIFGEIAATFGAVIFTPAMYVALTPKQNTYSSVHLANDQKLAASSPMGHAN